MWKIVQYLYNAAGLAAPNLSPDLETYGEEQQEDFAREQGRKALEQGRLAQEARSRGVLGKNDECQPCNEDKPTKRGNTTDPDDPCIKQIMPDGQQACYLVLSAEERAKGFVRPVRRTYRHVGPTGPKYDLEYLTSEEREEHKQWGYIAYEKYPDSEAPLSGRYWTKEMLDRVNKGGCGTDTTMGQAIAETYARNPSFYGGTYCVWCKKHYPVGAEGEFIWVDDGTRVGT